MFSKHVLSGRLSLSWSFGFSWGLSEPFGVAGLLVSPGPRPECMGQKENPGNSALHHFSGPHTSSQSTFFSPLFSLIFLLYLMPSVFSCTWRNRKSTSTTKAELF